MSNSGEKVFGHFPELPPELKMMLVDKMEPKDRCLFGNSSKLSLREAKTSKNAIYGLRIGDESDGSIYISVLFPEERPNRDEGYILVFTEENGKHMEYQSLSGNNEEIWRTELDASEDITRSAVAHFKDLLKTYQKIIKRLDIYLSNENFVRIDWEIYSLKNLESLNIGSNVDIRQFLPKIRRQLKNLSVEGVENCGILAEWEPIYQVQDYFHLPNIILNYQQFLRLSARSVDIPIGQITEQDIIHFLKSYHERTYSGRCESCRWVIEDVNFDLNLIFQTVDAFDGTYMGENLIPVIPGPSGDAEIDFSNNVLSFMTLDYYEEKWEEMHADDDDDYYYEESEYEEEENGEQAENEEENVEPHEEGNAFAPE